MKLRINKDSISANQYKEGILRAKVDVLLRKIEEMREELEELKNKNVPDSIKKLFVPMEEAVSIGTIDLFHFVGKDVDRWYNSVRSDFERSNFDLLLHSLIIQKGWYNTFDRGFNFYNRPVKLDYKHDVIEYR